MKLAEALITRADLQKRIEQLKTRLLRNAKIQEGEPPAEDPASLLAQLNELVEQWVTLVQNINRTNSATEVEAGTTITQAIAERDSLKYLHSAYRELAQAATVTQERSTKSEVKFKSAISVSETQRSADDFARRHRELDAKIQATNWETELSED